MNRRPILTVAFVCIAILGCSAAKNIAYGQFANSDIQSVPRPSIPFPYSPQPAVLLGEEMPIPYPTTELPPPPGQQRPPITRLPPAEGSPMPPPIPGQVERNPLPGEVYLNVNASARAALIGDSTRLNGTSGAAFLPSAIPVAGDPFAASDSRVSMQGAGSSVGFAGTVYSSSSDFFSVDSRFILQDASLDLTGPSATGSDTNISIQQAYGRYNGLVVGVTDTAISDVDALPEILDVAGPSARVTVFKNGTNTGQARISYFILRPEEAGWVLNLSLENPTPEINQPTGPTPGSSFDTFAEFPDLLIAAKYGDGSRFNGTYIEDWHLQTGFVGRSLGLENDNDTFKQSVNGWGAVLSGAYWFLLNPRSCQRDAVFGSIFYGEGIAHYIVDLRAPSKGVNNNDAMIDANGALVALPALAWYAAYTHNWSQTLRSTATFSQVILDSVVTPTQSISPYRSGEYAQVNLVYHNTFEIAGQSSRSQHSFFTGLEWLYGRRETLNGSRGQAHRLMWVVAFSK